ncbi:MAG: thioredoxin fold domain-containing protein [Deltaproteobacteria bacterium]|nr:thioredoxin fold domain-containing protein [Deltaproteobacteria bacterium]
MPEHNEYLVVCSHCGAKNRLPPGRLADLPSCGRCKEKLFSEDSPVSSGFILIPCSHCQAHNRVPLRKIAARPRCGKCRTPLNINLTSSSRPLALSDQNFARKVILSPLPTLVDFYSPNCGPCRLLAPTFNKLARDFEGRLQVATLNVEANQYIPTLYHIGGTPTLVIFQKGKEVSRLEGYHPASRIIDWIQPYTW